MEGRSPIAWNVRQQLAVAVAANDPALTRRSCVTSKDLEYRYADRKERTHTLVSDLDEN